MNPTTRAISVAHPVHHKGEDIAFLAGHGEMAALIRQKDWSHTPLGPLEDWPQSLRTTVSLCLASNFPINIVWGAEHTQIYNDGYRVACGEAHPRALGENYSVTWASAWPAIGEPFARALAGETSYLQNQRMFLTRNGYLEETFFTFSHSPIRDESGGIGGLFHPVTETTATMLAERRTRALRDLGTSLGAASDEADLAARVLSVLARFEFDLPFVLFYQLDPGTSAFRLVTKDAAAMAARGAPTCLAAGATSPGPFADALRSSQMIEVRDLSSTLEGWYSGPYEEPPNRAFVLPIPVPGAQRTPAVIVAGASPRLPMDESYRSFYDLLVVTISSALATVRAREDERRRAEALAEIDRAKTAFFSNVSHEFRTPLTLMLGPLEDTIADTSLPEHTRDQLQLAHRNSLRLLKLVNSLLDFSRIEAGRVKASYEDADLPALTRDLASTFRSAIERAGLHLVVECDALPEPVYVDRDMWEKIVLNLLSNAFKFTLQGSIGVRLLAKESGVVLEVADTGVGVPKDEIPRLFERFHRVAGSQGRSQEGSGIGLALVQELGKLHGASIDVTSEVGQGTTFRLHVPYGHSHLPKEQIKTSNTLPSTVIGAQAFVQEALRWLPDTPESEATRAVPLDRSVSVIDKRFATTAGARILLADDNADMRDYVRSLLEPHYVIHAAADGNEALATARRVRPDLILSDVMMPKLDGFGLLARIRSDESLRNTPIILLSARAGEEARIEGLDAGADDYLIKPFSARELLVRVGSLLQLRQMRQSAEEAFRLRTAQFETLFSAAPVGVYLVDADFRLREVNPKARPVFGDIPDLIGRDFNEVLRILWPKAFADELVLRFRHTLETGDSYFSEELTEQREDRGTTENYQWEIHRIPLPDGRHGVVCYFRDISAQIEARRELVDQREALRRMDRQKDEFLAMLAHELRNPLAPIRNASELLGRLSPKGSDGQAAVGILKRQVSQLTRLVDDLLDISRITQGRIQLKRTAVRLADVVAQAVETVEPLLREKRHAFSNISSYGSLHVHGDSARLVQCVANVLTNAAKYTDAGGSLSLECRSDGTNAVLRIRDNGSGISPELLPHIFDLFVQDRRTLDRAEGGLGIGLSLVRELVHLHGGSVSAESAGRGHGSTFEIRLPLQAEVNTTEFAATPAEPHRQRILVVDDNRDSADSLAMMLRFDGHTAQSVYTARQALKEIVSFAPEVVILDLGLPEMDGFELAREFRALPGLEKLRLLALTGYGQAEDKQKTRAAGFDGHLVKPVKYGELATALTRQDG
ncbi:MAG: ATP-binding protein [Gammaproteobacteria bacterium]